MVCLKEWMVVNGEIFYCINATKSDTLNQLFTKFSRNTAPKKCTSSEKVAVWNKRLRGKVHVLEQLQLKKQLVIKSICCHDLVIGKKWLLQTTSVLKKNILRKSSDFTEVAAATSKQSVSKKQLFLTTQLEVVHRKRRYSTDNGWLQLPF